MREDLFREINSLIKGNETLMNALIPTVEIFREVIVEMLKNRIIDIAEIQEEKKCCGVWRNRIST